MLAALLKFVPSTWLMPLAIGAAVFVALLLGTQAVKIARLQSKLTTATEAAALADSTLAAERLDRVAERNRLLAEALKDSERARALEAEMARVTQENADARKQDQARIARSVASFNAAADRLRNAIRNYTATPEDGGGEIAAGECRSRLGAAGDLLERAMRLATARTGDAERLNADAARMLAERRALTCEP